MGRANKWIAGGIYKQIGNPWQSESSTDQAEMHSPGLPGGNPSVFSGKRRGMGVEGVHALGGGEDR
jgi:hypothetical protein